MSLNMIQFSLAETLQVFADYFTEGLHLLPLHPESYYFYDGWSIF
jgi:hypothetical protein